MTEQVHFLNVGNGDCTLIKHHSGRNTVIDVNKAYALDGFIHENISTEEPRLAGNFHQKKAPVNPLAYIQDQRVSSIYRFILTHPEQDHMTGIKTLFIKFKPKYFWDTKNEKFSVQDQNRLSGLRSDDKNFYPELKRGKHTRRITFYSGQKSKYATNKFPEIPEDDGIQILSPTKELAHRAMKNGNYNDASYVLLFTAQNGTRTLFSGDSHNKTWEHILENWKKEVTNVDILIAPHHGRDSGRSYDFLDILRPKITFFGNAKSKDLAYSPWSSRNLKKYTNNQGGNLIAEFGSKDTTVYCTNEHFAIKENSETTFKEELNAWSLITI